MSTTSHPEKIFWPIHYYKKPSYAALDDLLLAVYHAGTSYILDFNQPANYFDENDPQLPAIEINSLHSYKEPIQFGPNKYYIGPITSIVDQGDFLKITIKVIRHRHRKMRVKKEQNARQHIIPQFYLKRFIIKGPLWVRNLDFDSNEIIEAGVKHPCFWKEHIYRLGDSDDSFDKLIYDRVEKNTPSILRKMDDQIILKDSEVRIVSDFITSSVMRHPAYLIQWYNEVRTRLGAVYQNGEKKVIPHDEYQNLIVGNMLNKANKLFNSYWEVLSTKRWDVFHFKDDVDPLITTDKPFCKSCNDSPNETADLTKASSDLVIHFPLGHHTLLMISSGKHSINYHTDVSPNNERRLAYSSMDNINKYIGIKSHKMIISANKEILSKLMTELKPNF